MHMADALISPAVGGVMWAMSGGLIALCARKVKKSLDEKLIPMMGVLGAFVFAAQMINFSIPGTGSSGHLGGGLLLAILLGPYAAFLVIASVLTVQAFFFADGGLLALGCNIFNLGFFPAFIAYPLIYRPMAGSTNQSTHLWFASLIAATAGLLMGAISVVIQTITSGITEIPFAAFCMLMLPIHFAIGLVEGLATASVVAFIANVQPQALSRTPDSDANLRPVLAGLALAVILIGGVMSWFASTHPDGLEWSIAKVTGTDELNSPQHGVHQSLGTLQDKTAILPDYGFPSSETESNQAEEQPAWPAVNAGTSVSGIVGGGITLILVVVIGILLKQRSITFPAK